MEISQTLHRLFDGRLFDMPPVEPQPVLSADRRRTLRRRQELAEGTHPTTKRPLLDKAWGFKCGDCDHHFTFSTNRNFEKCEKAAGGLTHGPASDVRLSWPACTLYQTSAEPN